MSQLAQVVLFYPGFWGFLKTCVISKMFLSKTTMLVVKTVRAFEKQYLRFAFLNFKSLCYFCLEVRTFNFTSKSRFSRKKNPPPFGSQTGGGSAKTHFFRVFRKKNGVLSKILRFTKKKKISITLKKHENQFWKTIYLSRKLRKGFSSPEYAQKFLEKDKIKQLFS